MDHVRTIAAIPIFVGLAIIEAVTHRWRHETTDQYLRRVYGSFYVRDWTD